MGAPLLKAKLREARAALDALAGAEKQEGKRPAPRIRSVPGGTTGVTQRPTRLDAIAQVERRFVWLDYMAYARRLFAPSEDVWGEVSRFIDVVRQAQRLVASEVIEISLDAFHRAALKPTSGADSRTDPRAVSSLRRLLRDGAPTKRASESIRGLHALYPDVPIVLVLKGGARWLSLASNDLGFEKSWDREDVDASSVYLADLVRSFSNVGVAGIVVDVRGQDAASAPEQVELHRPLFNVAQHYQWVKGVMTDPPALVDGSALAGLVDLVLCPEIDLAAVARPVDGVPVGGGLNERFWLAEESPELPERGLCYGEIPEHADPEQVLSRLARLRPPP
jgi:hypothetical protein